MGQSGGIFGPIAWLWGFVSVCLLNWENNIVRPQPPPPRAGVRAEGRGWGVLVLHSVGCDTCTYHRLGTRALSRKDPFLQKQVLRQGALPNTVVRVSGDNGEITKDRELTSVPSFLCFSILNSVAHSSPTRILSQKLTAQVHHQMEVPRKSHL